ncbi:hypothetical protein E4U53_005746 [Claviceps sorghi]|nr:hypothetical protein E4U53_005746 [Claviceps sorghi]
MAAWPQPKVLLFDIGGVCVMSPFQAILDYERSLSIPPGWINYSISRSGPNGTWQQLERGAISADDNFFASFNADLRRPDNWQAFYGRETARPGSSLPREMPPLPEVDGEWLFNEMMRVAQEPDPWMLPALKKLRRSGRYIMGALSNTVLFPEGHALHRREAETGGPLRGLFDVFISSAHVGVRKPDERMYTLAVETLDSFARHNAQTERGFKYDWSAGVKSADILFLDDIGENLKAAKRQGFRTVKVHLGRAYEAVAELERLTGLALQGHDPKVAIETGIRSRAKM